MISVKDSIFYKYVLKEFTYDFATVFVFDGIVISEINSGVSFS